MIDTAPSGDPDAAGQGGIVYASPSVERLTGLHPRVLRGREPKEVFHAESR